MACFASAGGRLAAGAFVWLAPFFVSADNSYLPQGGEFSVAGGLRGDQVAPRVSVGPGGGYLVWQDNATDGDGLGISALRLHNTLSGAGSTFRVNQQGAADQENPQVAMLTGGGAVFVWQGGPLGQQRVYTRFIGADGTFSTGDIRVSDAAGQQVDPVVTALPDGGALVAWSNHGQDGHMQGIFSRRFTASGQKTGDELQVNQFTQFNQRSPAAVTLADGNVVIAWVSEQQRFSLSVDLYARLLNSDGLFSGDEFRLNSSTNVCANPALGSIASGGFLAAWSQLDTANRENTWDIFVRPFTAAGQAAGSDARVNAYVKNKQFAPAVTTEGNEALLVWTSTGQDLSGPGIYGRFVSGNGAALAEEFQVHTRTISQQIQPAVAGDGSGRFLVVWSSFMGSPNNFDLFGQRYVASPTLAKPAPPFVSALSQSRLSVTWPVVSGLEVAQYELHIDGSSMPMAVTENHAIVDSLAPGSSHTVQLAYRLLNGQSSPLSDPASASTWSADDNFDGLPDDWQSRFWGADSGAWPDRNADSDGDGASNVQEFLAGTSPVNAQSVLRTEILSTSQGLRLQWNAEPGFVYQVQSQTDPAVPWTDFGLPRLAMEAFDSVPIQSSAPSVYYRIKRIR